MTDSLTHATLNVSTATPREMGLAIDAAQFNGRVTLLYFNENDNPAAVLLSSDRYSKLLAAEADSRERPVRASLVTRIEKLEQAVFPASEEPQLWKEEDLRFEIHRQAVPGGDFGITVIHIPSGISVTGDGGPKGPYNSLLQAKIGAIAQLNQKLGDRLKRPSTINGVFEGTELNLPDAILKDDCRQCGRPRGEHAAVYETYDEHWCPLKGRPGKFSARNFYLPPWPTAVPAAMADVHEGGTR